MSLAAAVAIKGLITFYLRRFVVQNDFLDRKYFKFCKLNQTQQTTI